MISKTSIIIKGGILTGLFVFATMFGFSEKSTTSNIAAVFNGTDTAVLVEAEPQLQAKRDGDSSDTDSDISLSPSVSPIMSPKTTLSPSALQSPSRTLEIIPTPELIPLPTPIPTSTPNPTPTPTPTPIQTSIPTESPSPSPTPEPEGGASSVGVVINEIAWMGTAASTNDEWIELHNTTSQSIDLTGWTLRSKDGTPSITLSGTVGPMGFYLIERTSDQTISDLSADQIYTGALGNGGEGLELRDNSGNLKDSAGFSSGWPAGDNANKSSMERINPEQSGDDASNWSTNNGTAKNGQDAGSNPINGTPKASNG